MHLCWRRGDPKRPAQPEHHRRRSLIFFGHPHGSFRFYLSWLFVCPDFYGPRFNLVVRYWNQSSELNPRHPPPPAPTSTQVDPWTGESWDLWCLAVCRLVGPAGWLPCYELCIRSVGCLIQKLSCHRKAVSCQPEFRVPGFFHKNDIRFLNRWAPGLRFCSQPSPPWVSGRLSVAPFHGHLPSWLEFTSPHYKNLPHRLFLRLANH